MMLGSGLILSALKLLFGQVKGACPSGRPRLSYNDVASSDCHECRITRP